MLRCQRVSVYGQVDVETREYATVGSTILGVLKKTLLHTEEN